MEIVVNRTGFDVKVSQVQQPTIYRISSFNYSITRNDTETNLPYHYIEVYVDNEFVMETQESSINLFYLITPMNKVPIEIKFIAKRVTGSLTNYAEPYVFIDRNMVVRWTLLCNNNSIIQE